jgi:hypothetical protein
VQYLRVVQSRLDGGGDDNLDEVERSDDGS